MVTTYEEIPAAQRNAIDEMVRAQVKSLDQTQKAIVSRTQDSLIYYIGKLAQEFARSLSYLIAMPLGYATVIAVSFARGFGEGWQEAWDEVDRVLSRL